VAQVLVVEDEEDIAFPLARTLEREGYEVARVETGRDALEEMAMSIYDVVILDLGLPDIDGLEVCRRAREDGYTGAIIILTGRTGELDRVDSCPEGGGGEGFDDVVVRAVLEEVDDRLVVIAGCRDDHGDGADCAQHAQQPGPVDVGQAEVQDDEIGPLLECVLEAGATGRLPGDGVALRRQGAQQRSADTRVVLDQQQRGHGPA
jgi:DNA-binding response OmpR family regulator